MKTISTYFTKSLFLLLFILASTQVFAWKPIMIGHRGCRQGVENTEQAFINGVTVYGFQGLECDVKVTKDGHYVCWHDDNIPNDKISNRNYDVAIASNLLKDLQDLDLTQTRNSVSYTGKICTVDRYLEICKQYNVIPVIELKSNTTICSNNMTGFPGLYALIEKHGLVDKAIILTSMDGSLTYIKEHYPHLKRQYLTNGILSADGTDELIEFCIENGCDISACYHYNNSRYVKEADVIKAHNAGIKVAFWTMNSLADYNKYGAYGPNFITSDDLGPKKVTLAELTGTDPNASKMIYFRPGTTNFSHGYQTIAQAQARSETAGETINNNVGLYSGVFWIKNAYVAIEVKNANGDSKFISKGIYRPDLFDDPTKRFLAMPLPEGYTKIAAYRLNSITTDAAYTTWTENPTTKISNRIPIINTNPGTIDIPSGDKNLLVNKEGWWDEWYWAYYLPKNNDVSIYFANNNNWEKVTMLTGKDIYTFPTAEFTNISGTKLYYLSLIGTDIGYEYYGFINSNTDQLGKGWTKGLIPPVNFTKSNAQNTSGIAGNNQFAIHNYVDHEFITDAAENTNLTNGTYVKDGTYKIEISSTKANRIANRIKNAANYTALCDDLLKGTNLFTPTSATNGSTVNRTPITSWQDLNHTHTVTVEEGGKLNYLTTWLTGASSSNTDSEADNTGTITFQAAYTASVTLRAIPNNGYVFLGFYDAESNKLLSRGVQEPYNSYPITHNYTYDAPNSAQRIIAKFVKGSSARKFSVRTMIYDNGLKESLDGGTFTVTHSGGITYTQAEETGYQTIYVSDAPMTLEATPKSSYEFIAWFNTDKDKRHPDNSWTIDDPTNTTKYLEKITAVFASRESYAKKQNINIDGLGSVKITYIFYEDGTSTTTTFDKNSSFIAWNGKNVTLTATPIDGYKFIGWYEGETLVSADTEYRYTATTDRNIIAKFVHATSKDVRAQTYAYNSSESKWEWQDNNTGGSFTMTHSGGTVYTHTNSGYTKNIIMTLDPVTFNASPTDGYCFIAWDNSSKGQFTDNPWIMENPANYDKSVTARFAQMYAQTIETTNNGGTVRIDYNNARKDTFATTTSGTYNVLTNSTVTVTANPFTGADFDGWYEGETRKSGDLTYEYTATAAKTLTARFTIPEIPVSTQIYQILTYNTEFDIFEEYNTGNAGKINISYTSKEHGAKSINTESSCAITDVKPETSVTLTASLIRTDHKFLGWYDETEKQLGTNTTYTYTPTTGQIIQARYAPIESYRITLMPSVGGIYTLRYGKTENFSNAPANLYSIESSITPGIYQYAYVSKEESSVDISHTQPIVGYEYKGFKLGATDKAIGDVCAVTGNKNIQANFVRKDDQIVYLNLRGSRDALQWSPGDANDYSYYAYAYNKIYATKCWIKLEHQFDYCYKGTIPGNLYTEIIFVQTTRTDLHNNTTIDINTVEKLNKSTSTTIPATSCNCYRLASLWKGGGWIDCWTTPPTHTNDYRIIYREQTVKSSTEIVVDYEHDSDIIKYVASGTKVDTVSLHIYNKVSNDGVIAINNPEIILQRCTGFVDGKSQWEDIESHMVFGPLKSDNPGVIRMPGRKNSAEIVVNRGIDIIKNDPTDNGCGVWNFPITQTNGEVTLKLDKVRRYSGNYYICTSNADGGRENYTHPANVLKYSKYAKENDRGYSHYFLRYINIATNDKPGTYKNLKFNIACDYASFLSKEHLTVHNRFKNSNGEYDRDKYVLEVQGEPNLSENANVRFSWDIVTNRVFRSYIAETSYRTNEHLVLDATNGLSNINPNDNYFVDNGNWIYNIDFNATSSANAKVKARLNGQYQYFMGSEDATEPITIGTGSTTFPARLLYDFKDDRLITFYKPDGIINGNIELATPLMMVREHHGEATQIQFANSGNQITTKSMDANDADDQYANPVYAVLTFLKSKLTDPAITHHEKSFYWISFPFDVKIKDVFGLGKYGQKWLIETYDGKKRSEEGLVTTGWKYITNTGTILKANKGYVLSLDYNAVLQENMFDGSTDGKISLFFPSRYLQTKQVIKNETNVTVELPEYNYNTAPHHNNWHTIGVPSFANSKVTIEQNDMPFVYEYWHPGDAYGPVAHGETPLKAMHSYMAQYSGTITWESIIRMTPLSLAAKKNTDADKKVMLRLELQQAGSTLDKTYVQLRNDKGTKGFDMSLDLTKIINAGANIYSIVDNHEMAGNAMPKEETVLPLGVVITAAGSYTFAMPQGTEGMIVELIDYEQGTSTNLLMSDYTITLDKGTFNQRFALRLVPEKVATSVEDITGGSNDDNVRKLLIDGVLYLQKDGTTYDAQGKLVK